MSVCPRCAKVGSGAAVACRHCGYDDAGAHARLARMLLAFAIGAVLVITACIERAALHDHLKRLNPTFNAWLTTPAERGDDRLAAATASGVITTRRSLVSITVDRARWQALPSGERDALVAALANSAFGRDLRGSETVEVYDAAGRLLRTGRATG